MIGLEGMKPNVLELDQFLETLLGELNPTVVGPGWDVDLGIQMYRQDNPDRRRTCRFGR